MSVVSVEARSFILALFIRDDGERFLLGDNGYDFIDSQLHFTANAIENDEVQKQGTDGVLVAGQVRRASVQTFDGYIGDATTPKSKIEQMRRDFFAFFAKGHHFRVIYVDCNRDAWQRKGGYLVDAPEVKELWQIHPEYHVGLNFEDVNYYEYDENAEGEEILANVLSVPISSEIEGGLEWDGDGAISVLPYGNPKTATGQSISVSDAVEAPISDFQLKGGTTQQTYTGKNLLPNQANSTSTGGITMTKNADGSMTFNGTTTTSAVYFNLNQSESGYVYLESGKTYTLSTSTPMPSNTRLCCRNATGTTTNYIDIYGGDQTSKTVTMSVSGDTFTYFAVYNTGTVVNNLTIYPMLEQSAAATTYEPYVGGVPAPNPDYPQAVQTVTGENVVKISDGQGNEQSYEVNLGKNLFDKNDSGMLVEGYLGSSKFYTSSGYWTYYVPCQPNTTYTASRTISGAGRFAIAWVDSSSTFPASGSNINGFTHNNNASSLTITTGSNAKYVAVWFYNANQAAGYTYDEWASAQQCEKGSTATSYADYFTPIELCKIGTYQDYIYKDGSKWYVRKECGNSTRDVNIAAIASDNTSGTTKVSAEGAFILFSIDWGNDYATTAAQARISSNIGIYKLDANVVGNTGAREMESGTFCQRQGTDDRIYFRNTSLIGKTGNEVKSLLAQSGGSNLWFPLATPTDTAITNSALIAQLEAILSQGYTYAGTNNITTVIAAGNEQGELEVEYYSAYQDGGYVWEEGGSGGPTTVVNESISAVYPVWTVYGPAQNPILENTTNNTSIEYVGMVADGQTLVIDMGAQTASLDGLNVLSALTGDFIQLEAGSNILLYSASNDAPASEIGWSEIVG